MTDRENSDRIVSDFVERQREEDGEHEDPSGNLEQLLFLSFRTDRRTSDFEFADDDGEESSGRGEEAAGAHRIQVDQDPNEVRSSQDGGAGVDV